MARPTQQEIDEFNARMAEPEGVDEDDFEIEIFTPEGHGARLPYHKGRTYLAQHFGIDVGDIPPNAAQGGAGGQTQTPPQSGSRGRGNNSSATSQPNPALDESQQTPVNTGVAQSYFGRRNRT